MLPFFYLLSPKSAQSGKYVQTCLILTRTMSSTFPSQSRCARKSLSQILSVSKELRDTKKEQVIGMIHPDTRVKLKREFAEREKEGRVASEDFFAILAALQEVQDNEGVNYNTNLVTKFIDQNADNEVLTLQDVYYVVGKFIQDAKKHSEAHAGCATRHATIEPQLK